MMKIVDSSKQTIIKEIENYFSKVVSKIEMSFSSLS